MDFIRKTILVRSKTTGRLLCRDDESSQTLASILGNIGGDLFGYPGARLAGILTNPAPPRAVGFPFLSQVCAAYCLDAGRYTFYGLQYGQE